MFSGKKSSKHRSGWILEREEASGACNAKVFKQLKMNIKSMNKEQVALDSFVGKRETPNGVGETMLLVGTRACVFRAYQE